MRYSPRAFLTLAAVVGTVSAVIDFDVLRMGQLVNELAEIGMFDDGAQIQGAVSCTELTIDKCYGQLNVEYSKDYEKPIVKSFLAKLKELLDEYNAAARAFVDTFIKSDDSKTPLKEEQVKAVSYHDSGAYCVLGIVDMHNVTGFGDQLSDYVFFDRLESVPGIWENLTFVKLLDDYLTWRGFESKVKPKSGDAKADSGDAKAESGDAKAESGDAKAESGDAKAESGTVSEKDLIQNINTVKQKINSFTRPFCNLQKKYGIQWIPAVTLTYARLTVAAPLFRDKIDGHLTFDHPGLSEKKGNVTMQSLIDTYSDFKKYGDISTFRDEMNILVDAYVFKVLTKNFVKLIMKTMNSFYAFMTSTKANVGNNNDKIDDRINQQNYLGSVLSSFKGLLFFYLSVQPITVDKSLSDFIIEEINWMSIQYLHYSNNKEIQKPTDVVNRLQAILNDSRFRLKGDTGESEEALNSIEDCIKLAERVNNALAYLTEAKIVE